MHGGARGVPTCILCCFNVAMHSYTYQYMYGSHSVMIRLTTESEIPIFQYSDGAAGGARARARVKEGGEEGAHWDWWCGRAA